MLQALKHANSIISVSNSLKEHVKNFGIDSNSITVVGNGVDIEKFVPLNKLEWRQNLGIESADKVIITVAGLVPRKGIHHVIKCIPNLRKKFNRIVYLVVGGRSGEGDWSNKLKSLAKSLNVEDHVYFLGAKPHQDLKQLLSCADLFVLATSNEGWANVFLESFACGIPVVTTDVGGNREVVCDPELGRVISYENLYDLSKVIEEALMKSWDKAYIRSYAELNAWPTRVGIIREIINNTTINL